MVVYFGSASLAFAIATCIAWLELVTSKYPRTAALLNKSWKLYVYSMSYGTISFFVMLFLQPLVEAGALKFGGPLVDNPWFQAVVVGISAKALLHIRLFNVTTGSQSFPVGVESVVHLYEPWLLENIDLDEWHAVRSFVRPRVATYDQAQATANILANLPPGLQTTMKVDLAKCTSVTELMEAYFRRCGRRAFDLAFPDNMPPAPQPVVAPTPPPT